MFCLSVIFVFYIFIVIIINDVIHFYTFNIQLNLKYQKLTIIHLYHLNCTWKDPVVIVITNNHYQNQLVYILKDVPCKKIKNGI